MNNSKSVRSWFITLNKSIWIEIIRTRTALDALHRELNCNCSLHRYLFAGNLLQHIPRLYSNYKSIDKTWYFSPAQLERVTLKMPAGGENDVDTFQSCLWVVWVFFCHSGLKLKCMLITAENSNKRRKTEDINRADQLIIFFFCYLTCFSIIAHTKQLSLTGQKLACS